MQDLENRKIPWQIKIHYSFLVTAATIMVTIGNNLAKYYTKFIGVSASLLGYAQLAFAIINSINDPFLGYLIDRTPRSRGGNKFTWYIFLSIPFFIIGMVFQLLGQPNWSPVFIFVTVFLGYSIYDTGLAMTVISRSNIVIEGSKSDKERSSIESLSLIIQTIFGIAGFLIPSYFLTGDDIPRSSILIMFIGFGLVGIAMQAFSAYGLRKTVRSFLPPTEKKIMGDYGTAFKNMIKQKSYILYILSAIFVVGVQANNQTFTIYYLDNFLDLENEVITLVSAIFLPLFLIVYAFGPTVIKKIGVKPFLIIGQVCTILGYTGILLGFEGYLAFGSLVLTSIPFWWVAALALFGKVFDEYEDKHGKIDKGVFFGINAILSSPAPSIVFFVFTVIIDAFGFDDTKPIQTANTKLGLRLGIGLLPLVLNVIALVLIFLMPKWKKTKKNTQIDLEL